MSHGHLQSAEAHVLGSVGAGLSSGELSSYGATTFRGLFREGPLSDAV